MHSRKTPACLTSLLKCLFRSMAGSPVVNQISLTQLENSIHSWPVRAPLNLCALQCYFLFSFGCITKHLLSGYAGNSEFSFPLTSVLFSPLSRERWGSLRNQNHCLPWSQTFNAFCHSYFNLSTCAQKLWQRNLLLTVHLAGISCFIFLGNVFNYLAFFNVSNGNNGYYFCLSQLLILFEWSFTIPGPVSPVSCVPIYVHYWQLLIMWPQKYSRYDCLLSGHYFLVMTGHKESFSRLDGFFELWVKVTSAWAKTTKKMDVVQLFIFSINERKTSLRILL